MTKSKVISTEDMQVERRAISTQFQISNWEEPFIKEFGKDYQEYRRNWEKCSLDWRPDFPLHIDFQLQDSCNMRCTFCPRHKDVAIAMKGSLDWINTGRIMSLDLFKRVIDEGAKNKLRAINLGSTSEPLLHPDVVEMVRYAREKGVIDIRIITNGLLLKDDMIRQLYGAGLTYLGISVDAWKAETYKKVRKNKLSTVMTHAQRAAEIRTEMKLEFPRLRVSFVNTPEAKGEFEPFLNYWKDKVDFIELQDFDDYAGETVNNELMCLEPFRRLMVWASGIVGCISWDAEEYPYGNLKDNTIKECWESDAANKLRDSFKTKEYIPMCLGCYGKMETKDDPNIPIR